MRPYERWSRLWQLFIALDMDWDDDYVNEEEAVMSATGGWGADDCRVALVQWHEAFDSATDGQLDAIVADFNPTYEPTERFGGYRGWAEWVREHLERELAQRG
jgi:hypothetical protein